MATAKGIKGTFSTSTMDRFWERVSIPSDPRQCWIWLGTKTHGYGEIFSTTRKIKAHRFSWELHNAAEIPDHLLACHKCDNPSCVNPDHIFIGTMKDNIGDARSKGRLNPYQHQQTHCKHGHEFSDENTYSIPKTGYRVCRTCKLQNQRNWRMASNGR